MTIWANVCALHLWFLTAFSSKGIADALWRSGFRVCTADASLPAGRFAQSPSKEDPARYRHSLEQSSKKWLRQLESMGLPASIMRDAREEAPQLVESKMKARTAFAWP